MLTLILGSTALATAVLSGVFGMAGGMVLMGVFTSLLPVSTAMVMHGSTQLLSNIARTYILRRHVYLRGLLCYLAGSLGAYLMMLQLHYAASPLAVFLGLGLTPFVAALLPARWLDFQRPGPAVVTGFQVAAVQLIAGAAGPLLNIAFVNTRLNRNQVVATKAATQCFSHALKLAYFLPSVATGTLSPPLIAATFVATLLGTRLGTWLLHHISEPAFKRCTRALVYTIGWVYLGKAAWLMLR